VVATAAGRVARGPNGGRRARDKRNHAFGCGWEATDPQGAGLLRLTGSRVVGHGDQLRLSSASVGGPRRRPPSAPLVGAPRRRPSSAPLVGASCTSDADEQGWGQSLCSVLTERRTTTGSHHAIKQKIRAGWAQLSALVPPLSVNHARHSAGIMAAGCPPACTSRHAHRVTPPWHVGWHVGSPVGSWASQAASSRRSRTRT
jgi:hypothetical protein